MHPTHQTPPPTIRALQSLPATALEAPSITSASSRTRHVPQNGAPKYELRQRKLDCPDFSPETFLFANAERRIARSGETADPSPQTSCGGARTSQANLQVLRRTRATCAQTSVKDIQAHLRHSRANTTANEYVQEFPRNVHHVVGTICAIPTSTATPQLIM